MMESCVEVTGAVVVVLVIAVVVVVVGVGDNEPCVTPSCFPSVPAGPDETFCDELARVCSVENRRSILALTCARYSRITTWPGD